MAKSITEKQKTDVELCQIIATSVTEIVRDSLNLTFRQKYFDTIQVTNSTDGQKFLENQLLNSLGTNKLCEQNNEKMSLEDYIASKVMHPTDASDIYKHSEMITLIKHILMIDSKSEEIKNSSNFIATDVLSAHNIFKNVDSRNKNKNVWTDVKHTNQHKEQKNKRCKTKVLK